MTTPPPLRDPPASAQDRQVFWWLHIKWPLLAFLLIATLLESAGIDRTIAHAWYYDEVRGAWLGSKGTWSNTILHLGAARAVRALAALILLLWAGSFVSAALQPLRRTCGFLILAMTLSVGLVGALKQLTNIDCPWDLQEFGGEYPYVTLFGDRPDVLRAGHCFPAAHASSGFALLAFYFVLREYAPRWASWALWTRLVIGTAFGIAQQARGAHFLSHDVFSAFLVWVISLSVYVFAFNCNVRWGAPAWRTASVRTDQGTT
jgi:membrane-associated PAP2 superfamily phosphatase